jgi:hypothetical protein
MVTLLTIWASLLSRGTQCSSSPLVEPELLEDKDMYMLCEQAKRGGYSGVCTRQYTAHIYC